MDVFFTRPLLDDEDTELIAAASAQHAVTLAEDVM